MSSEMPPRLGRALLGLIEQDPMSGYDLRKLFATTPLEAFSDSPGSIYPALKRLERQGLITGVAENTESRRPRRVYHVTAEGRATLRAWLTQPVTMEDVKRNASDLTLRFAFMEPVLGAAAVLRFLADWEEGLEAYTQSLEEFIAIERATMTLTGRLALESGIEGVHGQLLWVRRAITELRAAGAKEER